MQGNADPEAVAKAERVGREFKEHMSAVDSEGIAWVAATSQAVAFDRMMESAREDRLFDDALAKYFVGERGESISNTINEALGMHWGIEDFHRMWTAVRTKYINDVVAAWIDSLVDKGGDNTAWQVTNLGVGVDTRAFWLNCLANGSGTYIEVDVESILKFKEKELAKISPAPIPICNRQVIIMDFEKESLADLPKHGYDSSPPTLWILEGLVMYMQKAEVVKLINHIAGLSTKGSCAIINYMGRPDCKAEDNASNIDYIEAILLENGWTGARHCCGGDVINYGRFPKDKPPLEDMGFGTYYLS